MHVWRGVHACMEWMEGTEDWHARMGPYLHGTVACMHGAMPPWHCSSSLILQLAQHDSSQLTKPLQTTSARPPSYAKLHANAHMAMQYTACPIPHRFNAVQCSPRHTRPCALA